MPQLNTNRTERFSIKRTKTNLLFTENGMSPLGKKLMKIASEIEHSDEPVYDEADIEKELEKRRGGYVKNGR
jgi:hypothetical protein